MKFHLLFALLILNACSPQSKVVGQGQQSAVVTQQTQADLVTKLKNEGVFDSVQISAIDRDFQVVNATSGENYFIKDGAVVSSTRLPKDHERTLLYWRYQFKGKTYHESRVEGSWVDQHTVGLRQLVCNERGMGVVYNPTTEQVTRVFYYEAK